MAERERKCVMARCPQCKGWVYLDASDKPDAKTIGELALAQYEVVHVPVDEARRTHLCRNNYAGVPCHDPKEEQ